MKNFLKSSFVLLLVILTFISCDKKKETSFSGYNNWKSLSKITDQDSLFIVNVGDFSSYQEASIESNKTKRASHLPALIKVGGINVLASYLNIIKERFKRKAIILSANNMNYQYYANKKKVLIPLDAIKVPIEHFETSKPPELFEYPWVNSNVLNVRTGKPHEQEFLKDKVVIKENKNQLVTITAINNVNLINNKKINGFYFQDSVSTFLKYEKDHFNIVLYHGPTECESHHVSKPTTFQKSLDYQLVCEKLDPLKVLVDRLPKNSIDLIVASKKIQGVGFIQETPIVFSGESSHFVYPIILHLKKKKKLSYLLPPIKLCHQMLMATQDCHLQNFSDDSLQKLEQMGPTLVPAKFLNYDIKSLTD